MAVTQSRQPKGVPVGGQYATTLHAETTAVLERPTDVFVEGSGANIPSPAWRTRRQEIREARRQVNRLMDIDEDLRTGRLWTAWNERRDELVNEGLDRQTAEARLQAETGMERPNGMPGKFAAEAEGIVQQVGSMIHDEALYRAGPPPPPSTEEEISDAENELIEARDAYRALPYSSPPEDQAAARDRWNTAARHLVQLKDTDPDGVWRARYSEAARQTLSEIRPLGDQCGHVFHELAQKPAVKAVNKAFDYFPSDWIEASSNYQTALCPKVSKRRAHYADNRMAKKTKRVQQDPIETHRQLSGGASIEEGLAIWKQRTHYGAWGPSGWVERKILDVRPAPDNQSVAITYSGGVDVVTVARSTASELTTDKSESTTTHEVAHRMEYANPKIRKLESAFYRRRTTGADGEQEQTRRYRRGRSNERVRPDGFVEEYIGKDYSGDAYEVMSVGVEAVFHGGYGALQGVGHAATDIDHARFVLGTLATV